MWIKKQNKLNNYAKIIITILSVLIFLNGIYFIQIGISNFCTIKLTMYTLLKDFTNKMWKATSENCIGYMISSQKKTYKTKNITE